MIRQLLAGFIFAAALAAQSISGSGSGAGQTATASVSLVPALQLAFTISCTQVPPFSTNPSNLWAGDTFNCTITTNQAAPPGGSITVTLTPAAPPPGTPGVPVAGVTLTVSPTTVVIPSPGTIGTFTVKATSP